MSPGRSRPGNCSWNNLHIHFNIIFQQQGKPGRSGQGTGGKEGSSYECSKLTNDIYSDLNGFSHPTKLEMEGPPPPSSPSLPSPSPPPPLFPLNRSSVSSPFDILTRYGH